MPKVKSFRNSTRGTEIAQNARVADNFITRLVGLLASKPLAEGEGLLITPCSQIHMIGMKFPIDALFLDKDWHVVGIVENIQPGQISKIYKAKHCLELASGAIARSATQLGDSLEVS